MSVPVPAGAPAPRVALNRLRANDFRLARSAPARPAQPSCRHEHSSVTDRAALSDLVHRYAANVDDRQFDSVAELFTATAELTVPEPPAALRPVHSHRGQAAIAAAVAAVAQTVRTQHAIVGEVYSELSEEVPEPAPRADASRASRITSINARTSSSMWSGICATTTSMR